MKNHIAELVKLYTGEESIIEQAKNVKDEIKAAGGDAAICSAVAKAIVHDKIDALKEKCQVTEAMIALSRS